MGEASRAAFYVVFAFCTVYLNIVSVSTWNQNALYRTVTNVYAKAPFQDEAGRTLYVDGISNPDQLYLWLSTAFKKVTFNEVTSMSNTEWGDLVKWNSSSSPNTVGSFNRMVMIRMTAKRWKMEKTMGVFKLMTPQHLGKSRVLDSSSKNTNEDSDDACIPAENISLLNRTRDCMQYEVESSFDGSGGFADFVNPMDGPEVYQASLDKMWNVNLFDLRLATFTVDAMIYNSNLDQWLNQAWIFKFDFAGNCKQEKVARGFNLNVFNTNEPKYMGLYILRCACMIMLFGFLSIELKQIWDLGIWQHFRRSGNLTDMISIWISIMVLSSYWIIEMNDLYTNFRFEMLLNQATRAETYVKLTQLASTLQDQSLVIAFDLMLVCIRTTSLVSCLHSDLGLIIEVLSVSMSNLTAFFVMFITLQMGFILMSFFTFGAGYPGMSSFLLCFSKCFAMLAGEPVYDDLAEADAVMAPIFFYIFYIFFYLVMINIFVTLLMSGYDTVDWEISKKKRAGEKEKNPLELIFTELKNDIVCAVTKYGGTGIKWGGILCSPVIFSIKACIFCSPPAFVTNAFSCCTKKSSSGKGDGVPQEEADKGLPQDAKSKAARKWKVKYELLTMVMFMVVWVMMMALQSRGEAAFLTSQVTLHDAVRHVTWDGPGGAREEYKDIHSFAGVQRWTNTAIVGLYSQPACATKLNDKYQVVEAADCSSDSDNSQQLIQQIKTWNIGFLNTTLVRLTIQPACFVPNPDKTWAEGMPTLRKTPDTVCASAVCTDVLEDEECHTSSGRRLKKSDLDTYVSSNPIPYDFAEPNKDLGSAGMLGGFVFSLGNSEQECKDMLRMLDEDGWFSQNSASMVFDWITYNGNLDMFTHNQVSFSLMQTGVMKKDMIADTFPLNMAEGGGFFWLSRIMILVLFAVYVCLLSFHMAEMIKLVVNDYSRSRREEKGFLTFVSEFYSDPWHVVDTISLTISSLVVVNFLLFVSAAFRATYRFSVSDLDKFVVSNNDVSNFGLAKAVETLRYLQDDWYIFLNFERTASNYHTFLSLAALNSLFISIRVVKVVNKFELVHVFSQTLGNAKGRNAYFIVVIFELLCGFAFAMMLIFGVTVEGFSDPINTLGTLCYWLAGEFDLQPLLDANSTLAVVFFVAFIVVFRFICVNMFLATQLNSFAELVGKMDIEKAKAEMDKEKLVRIVEYPSKDALKADITVERQDDNEVIVKIILDHNGLAVKQGIGPGHILFKVNRQRDDWRREGIIDIIEDGMQEDSQGIIRIIFKDPQKLDGFSAFVKAMLGGKKNEPASSSTNVKPTVKNFWRNQGAIQQIHREVADVQPDEDEVQAEEAAAPMQEEDGEEGGEGDEDDLMKGKTPTAVKFRAKKRLDGLLFSRWPDGTEGGSKEHPALQLDHLPHAEPLEEDDVLQEDWDVFDLKERVDKMPVSGNEVWLDCLMAELERQDDENIVTEVLRTSDLQDAGKIKRGLPGLEKLLKFYINVDQVLKILEHKANRKYYQSLQMESEHRQDQLRKQNEVLHDYVCELEGEFGMIMNGIHRYKSKKELMLTKLAGLLDREQYKHLDRTATDKDDESHLARLSRNWKGATMLGLMTGLGSSPPAIETV